MKNNTTINEVLYINNILEIKNAKYYKIFVNLKNIKS